MAHEVSQSTSFVNEWTSLTSEGMRRGKIKNREGIEFHKKWIFYLSNIFSTKLI
jgi:hypothetical protein